MSAAERQQTVAEQVLASDNREVQLLVARGLFPLPPQEMIPLQVELARSQDDELASSAHRALRETDPRIIATVVAESVEPELIAYFAEHHDHPVVLEGIIRHQRVAGGILGQIATRLSPELQEILLLRRDLIIENPAILKHLEANPALSAYSRRRVAEYRDHLLPKRKKPTSAAPDLEEALAEELTEEEVAAAIAEAMALPAEGERDESTGLTEAQIRTLPVPVRLKLSRGASRTLRSILIRDKHPMVAVAVLFGSALSDSEVEQIASSRSVVEEVLDAIAHNRQWSRKYNILLALVRNPRISIGLAVRLAPRLSIRDLRSLSKDRNVSDAVRSTAGRLYRIKTS